MLLHPPNFLLITEFCVCNLPLAQISYWTHLFELLTKKTCTQQLHCLDPCVCNWIPVYDTSLHYKSFVQIPIGDILLHYSPLVFLSRFQWMIHNYNVRQRFVCLNFIGANFITLYAISFLSRSQWMIHVRNYNVRQWFVCPNSIGANFITLYAIGSFV